MKKVAEVLDELREEERRLSGELSGVHRAIAALEEVMGIAPAQSDVPTALEQSAPPQAGRASGPKVASGPYATAGFYDAAAAYLSAAGEPKTARQIAEALQAGGYPTRASNFSATARTMLHRLPSENDYGIRMTEGGSRWFIRE